MVGLNPNERQRKTNSFVIFVTFYLGQIQLNPRQMESCWGQIEYYWGTYSPIGGKYSHIGHIYSHIEEMQL